ncbi:hypothetical protein [Spirosoma sp.]|uniref:hypothetical protein n=1 Tax=Spirosoma sp. TaxID=1899569 RepID=UPI002618040E|nr:hypothetical protein [Spirosoma sp.]MCX6216468.1 hypothetical protein [Spirosoma sp.]
MLFQDPVLFELPVLPRVQKFIRTKLHDQAGYPQPMLAVPTAPGAGLMLWAMAQAEMIYLSRSPSRNKATRHAQPEAFTAKLGIGIYEFHPTRQRTLLNHPELLVFSNMVDHMIQNELVLFCQQAPKTPPMVRIKAFCDHYDFSEEDYSEAALKQMYLRYRRGTGSHGFAPQLTQQFAFVPVSLAA